MIAADWFAYARTHRDALYSLISRYHPQLKHLNPADVEITAPGAEAACRLMRNMISRETTGMLWPTVRFDAALADGDYAAASMILSETWMGVPESTSCWEMEGFAQCVELLDDPVECDGSEDET